MLNISPKNKPKLKTNVLPSQILKIDPGEYQIHLFIEETRGLENPEEISQSIDPLIKITVFEETRTAGPKIKVGNGQLYWGEHFFFTKKIENNNYFFSHKMKFEVLNYHKIGKNSLVGEISLDLVSIYKEPNHCLLHKWAALSNFNKNYEEVKGFMKFSITISGEKDEPIVLEKERISIKTKAEKKLQQHIGKGGSLGAEVLLAPQLKMKRRQMKIALIKGDELMKLDYIGSIDSYLIIEFGNARIETEPISNNRNPFYGMNIYLPYSEPSINEFLSITVMDYDRGKKDDVLGSLVLTKTDIINHKYKEIGWLDIYGSQPDSSNTIGELMNGDSNIGAFWKGRILLSIESFDSDKPKFACEKMETNETKVWKNNIYSEYFILAELHYGFSLPKENASYSVQIRWADKELIIPEKKSNKSLCEWYSRKQISLSLPYLSSNQLPDLIIYLCLNNKRISYYRTPVQDFLNYEILHKNPRLFHLIPEKSLSSDIRHDLAGVIKLRLGILCEKNMIEKVFSNWDTSFKKPEIKQGVLISNIFHCKNLIPSDNEGTSDPFIAVSYYGNESVSNVIEQTLNPVWNESIHLNIPIVLIDGKPDYEDGMISIKCFDKDSIKLLDTQVYSNDEFLGAGYVFVKKAKEEGFLEINSKEKASPKWIPLEYNGLQAGKLLISFNILENESSFPLEITSFEPVSDEYTIKISILGLRCLKSNGILNIQKPFIKFDVNGLRSQTSKLKENKIIIVNSLEGGSDPNFSAILKFQVELPKNHLLCPSLTCVVFDTIWEGVIQPVLGSFAIDLGAIIEENSKKNIWKYNKKQSHFIEKESSPTNDDIFLDIEKDPLIRKKAETENKSHKTEENTIISDQLAKKHRKYPAVLMENGELHQEYMIIKPKYVKNLKKQFMTEMEIPEPEAYIGLGHDKTEDKLKNLTKKHYRYYINQELEKSHFINQNLFHQFPIYKGKRFVEEDLYEPLIDQKLEEVGLFKGWVDIYKENINKENEENIVNTDVNFIEEDDQRFEELDSLILKSQDILVRVYVIDALNLQPMDNDSLSDPYLQLILGSNKINNREEYKKDQANVGIFRLFELRCKLPGPSQLKVQVWDHDFLLKDDLIGETTIDLENRYFSKKWRSLHQKPIETRVLYQPTSSLPRGKIRLWLELIPLETIEKTVKWFIEPKPILEFEIRVVVWDCNNVPSRDQEGTSDIYVSGKIGNQTQQTDTHLRSNDGYGSFNWRMVWRIMLPNKDNTITFQIWDQDFMTDDDFIAEATVNFEQQAALAYENDAIAKIYGKKMVNVSKTIERLVEKWMNPKGSALEQTNEIFKIELKNLNKEGLSVKKHEKLFNKSSFSQIKDSGGTGRKDPNVNPWLPPPLKRYNFTFDPKALINSFITPKVKAKIVIGTVLGLCVCCILLFAIVFLAGIASNGALN